MGDTKYLKDRYGVCLVKRVSFSRTIGSEVWTMDHGFNYLCV